MIKVIANIIANYCAKYKMLNIFKNPNNIYWGWLSINFNPNAIHILERNIDNINCNYLSMNPNAIHL